MVMTLLCSVLPSPHTKAMPCACTQAQAEHSSRLPLAAIEQVPRRCRTLSDLTLIQSLWASPLHPSASTPHHDPGKPGSRARIALALHATAMPCAVTAR